MDGVGGHLLPGGAFLVIGVQWSASIIASIVIHEDPRGASRAWYPVGAAFRTPAARAGAWPVESVVKLAGAGSGILVECYAKNFDPRRMGYRPFHAKDGVGFSGHVDEWVHVSMYAFFAHASARARLCRPRVWARRVPGARARRRGRHNLRLDHARAPTRPRAFAPRAAQMAMHASHGSAAHRAPPYFELLHTLHSYAMIGVAVAAWSEAWQTRPEDAQLGALLRAYFAMLSGWWMWNMAQARAPSFANARAARASPRRHSRLPTRPSVTPCAGATCVLSPRARSTTRSRCSG
jgi:hypothetical protein